ncbi:MAG: hypothetical protein EHM48_01220 [Planctomycetaceae bacterium]|nr:MAG: hypothetical protein EHM48_01220 [Planctomycetaceae bacterium]
MPEVEIMAALTGILTGIDTSVLITDEMTAYKAPITRLTTEKSAWQSKSKAVDDISSRITSLDTLLETMRDSSKLQASTAISSKTDVLTTRATSAASVGSHTVEVNRLATAERKVHSGAAASDSLVGEGAFVYTYNGTTRTVYTSATTTLSGLSDLINNDSGNAGVSASLLQYDAGNGQVYHLVLSGKNSGSSYGVTIDDATTLNGSNGTMDFSQSTFTTTQTAQDAQIRVDGYPDGNWITRDSNSISDVIAGVTFTLQSVGSATVTVSQNTDSLKTNMSNLVAIYNGIITQVGTYTGYNAETKVGGLLQGDSIINMLVDPIRSAFTTNAKGFTSENDSFTMAAQVGLTLDKDGKLLLDETVFSEAVSKDYSGVLRLMGAIGKGNSDNAQVQFNSADAKTTAGQYNVKITYDAAGTAQAWIKQTSDTEWREMNVTGSTITGKVDNAEQGLSLTGVWDSGRGAYTAYATINVQQGLAGKMYEATQAILDPTTGTIKTRKDQYDSAIAAIDRNIETKQRMADNKEAALKAKYARMEALLSELESLKGTISAMTTSLDSNSNDDD